MSMPLFTKRGFQLLITWVRIASGMAVSFARSGSWGEGHSTTGSPDSASSAKGRAELLPGPDAVLVEQHGRGNEEGFDPPQAIGDVALGLVGGARALQLEVRLVETTALHAVLEDSAVLDERGAVTGEEQGAVVEPAVGDDHAAHITSQERRHAERHPGERQDRRGQVHVAGDGLDPPRAEARPPQ